MAKPDFKSAYAAKLRDPRWQRRRLEVLNRDDWTCRKCFGSEDTLHVHHRRYITGREPWDYPDELLVTLCEMCHATEKEEMEDGIQSLIEQAKHWLFGHEVLELAHMVNLGGWRAVADLTLIYKCGYTLQKPPDASVEAVEP